MNAPILGAIVLAVIIPVGASGYQPNVAVRAHRRRRRDRRHPGGAPTAPARLVASPMSGGSRSAARARSGMSYDGNGRATARNTLKRISGRERGRERWGRANRPAPARIGDLPTIWLGELTHIREIEPEHEARWSAAADRNLASWIAGLDRTMVMEIDGEPAGYETWAPTGGAAVLTTINVVDGFRQAGRALFCCVPSSATSGPRLRRPRVGRPPRQAGAPALREMPLLHTHDEGDYRDSTPHGE